MAHTVSISPTHCKDNDSAMPAFAYILLCMPPTRRIKFSVNSGMRFSQFNKYIDSIKIILLLLGEEPHQVLYRGVSLESQSKPVRLRIKTWGSRRMCTLCTTASKWQRFDLNPQLTAKPMCALPFQNILILQNSQPFKCVHVCSNQLTKAVNSQNCRFLASQNISHDFNGFAIFSKQTT